ncbi:MAG: ice-binding family protein, partial [Spirochaetota bacterium]
MKTNKKSKKYLLVLLAVITISVALVGCNKLIETGESPLVISTLPADQATDVAIDADITATFSGEMDNTTIDTDSFTLYAGTSKISGTVTYDAGNLTASFNSAANLATGTTYTATVTTAVTNAAGNAMAQNKVWTFTTVAAEDVGTGDSGGPGSVELGTAANYAILAKSGVSTTGTTMVTGDIGLSPASSTELTGFSPVKDASGEYSTSDYVTGRLYASDYATPTPATLTTAISDMETAYTSAAGFTNPDYTNLGA